MEDVTLQNNTPITSNENTDSPPQQQQPEKKYEKNVIKLVGLDTCGHCIQTEKFIQTELKPNSDVPVEYTKIDANSPEGQLIKDEKKLKFVPYVEQCLIPVDKTKPAECTEINEFKKDWFRVKVNS